MDREIIKQKVLSYYLALRNERGHLDLGNTPSVEDLSYSERVIQVLMDATSQCFLGEAGIRDKGILCDYTEQGIDTFRGILDNALNQYLRALGKHDEDSFRESIGELERACATDRAIFKRHFSFIKPGEFRIPEPEKRSPTTGRKQYQPDNTY